MTSPANSSTNTTPLDFIIGGGVLNGLIVARNLSKKRWTLLEVSENLEIGFRTTLMVASILTLHGSGRHLNLHCCYPNVKKRLCREPSIPQLLSQMSFSSRKHMVSSFTQLRLHAGHHEKVIKITLRVMSHYGIDKNV
jgi:hypothetical protein